jgi:hypothetical protein
MKKLSTKRIAPFASTTTTTNDFDFDFLSSKCTSSCYHQLSSTIKTTATSACCCCCCCCCCCGGSNQQQQSISQNSKQIYLARSNSGYKLVQVIDNKVSQKISSIKNHKNAYYDLKSKHYNNYNSRKSYNLPLSLRPIDAQEFENNNIVQPIIKPKVAQSPKICTSTTATTTSYDVSCNQAVNCNGYLKKLIEKTKKKAQSIKKKGVGKTDIDSIKKHKMSLFPRKVKKSLIKQNEFKVESSNNVGGGDDEISDNIENRSFVQDTFLTDFNQFGQFRVWYV